MRRFLSALLVALMLVGPACSAPQSQKIKRDGQGHIIRSSKIRREFMRQTGYPYGRPGYIIDHIVPLKRGGKDEVENLQWQTVEEAKEKDTWE